VGVVGTGALGFHHARLLRHVPGAECVGIYDRNSERAAYVSRELGLEAFPTLAALLERTEAVTVAVPTPAHADVGMAVLASGVHALVEKPLADTVEGAERLVAAAQAAGVVLQVGHVERFNRAVRAALPYLDEPWFLQTERLAPFQPRGTDVAVILDLMIHDLDERRTGADTVCGYRQRACGIRQRSRRAHHGQPHLSGAHAQAAHLPAIGIFLARSGTGRGTLLPAQARVA
jgi:predicted dehydrogenase